MSEQDKIAELEKKVEELQKQLEKYKELEEKIDKLKKAVEMLTNLFEDHVKGKWTLDDIKVALQNINDLVNLLIQAGVVRMGEGGNVIQALIAQQLLQNMRPLQQSTDTEISKLSKKESQKLKKFLDEDEEE